MAKAAREAGIKVALSGLGADECFGGYPSFRDVPRSVHWLRPISWMPGLGALVRRGLSGAIAALPCLTIAALNGTLAGGAMGMVLACDLRLAAPGAKFFYPVMKLGFLPQPSDPRRLAALIGRSRAGMILMGGQKIDAGEARRWGRGDRIVEPGDLMDQARALAADALAARPDHAAAIKALLGASPGQT